MSTQQHTEQTQQTAQQQPLADMRFQVKITATAEVRDAQGRLLNPDGTLAEPGTQVTGHSVEELTGRELAARYSDDELRAAGFTDTQVADLRASTSGNEEQG